MNASTTAARTGRRALAVCALACAFLAASLAAAGEATAAYAARVQADTLRITGDGAGDRLVLRLQPGSPTMLQVDVGADGTAEFTFDRGTFTAIVVEAGAGDDEVRIDQSSGAFFDELVTLSGGSGADTLLGGSGAETLLGGWGNDVVAGGDGNDRALLGGGADTFTWNPGDDDDVVEGEGGDDLLAFNGNGAPETIGISANGPRVLFTRNVAAIELDLAGIERVGFRALGGVDTIVVGDLAGTDVETTEIDLAAIGGGGDLQADTVVARGTEGADRVEVGSPDAGTVLVSGLAADVRVAGGEASLDSVGVSTLGGADTIATGIGVSGPMSIDVDGGAEADTARYVGTADADTIAAVANGAGATFHALTGTRLDTTAVESVVLLGLGGSDTITAVGNLAPLTALTFDGGEDGDVLRGGNGADLLFGGNGGDFVDGNQGEDRALLGGGDDRFEWAPGDGSDIVEGQGGSDLLDFFGNGAPEKIDVSASGRRVRLTRNVASIVMDVAGVEGLLVRAFGGTDTLVVNDLAGTGVATVDVDLNTFGGVTDAQADTVVVNGTNRRDVVQLTRSGPQVLATGLAAQTRIVGGEAANDTLLVQTLGGNDDVTLEQGVKDLLAPVVDLGASE